MSDYSSIYPTGIDYYSNEVAVIADALSRGRCVALCSSYKMGDRLFVDYLNFNLKSNAQFQIYYDESNLFSEKELRKVQEADSTRTKVLLLPWYFRKPASFTESLLDLMRDRRNTFLTVMVLTADFLDNPEHYFPDTNTPMEVVLTRLPLSRLEAEELIDTRSMLEKKRLTQIQKNIIIQLSGGHIALIKRLFLLTIQGYPLTVNAALHDPPTKAVLLQIEMQTRTLSRETLVRIGLLNSLGEVALPLLQHFIDSIDKKGLLQDLSPENKLLLDTLKSKDGEYTTLEEVHKILFPNKLYSMWATYKAIERFAKAIESQYRIQNIKGKGYLLRRR